MSSEWEEHRGRFAGREETFDAYVDVWSRDLDTRRKFADWDTFARCADADLAMVRKAADLVRQAELLMSRNGYRLGTGAGGSSRRWQHTRGEVRTTSERPVHDPAKVRSGRRVSSNRAPAAPKPPREKRPAPPPKAPPKPTHVECPYDPGMMVPLTGSCMCGWSPADDG
jgi:hypothetical protein